jgi:hypothetical protein
MLKAVVTYWPTAGLDPITVVMGNSEDVAAPRGLQALEKAGLVINDDVLTSYKAYLAGKRQGDITNIGFEAWAETVEEIDPRFSEEQLAYAVATGAMKREQADGLREIGKVDVAGESPRPRAE